MRKLWRLLTIVLLLFLLLGFAVRVIQSTKNISAKPNDPPDGTDNWLFQNEYITDEGRTDLPEPVFGVSYTLFVDGEEILTTTVTYDITFVTEDCSIYFFYDSQDRLWRFHPVDSQVRSGYVSIRINE